MKKVIELFLDNLKFILIIIVVILHSIYYYTKNTVIHNFE